MAEWKKTALLAGFQIIGEDLARHGLVSSHGGNLSLRLGERLLITRRGSMLGRLAEKDIMDTGLFANDRATPLASSELAVHRAIYHESTALAVVHAHPVHAVALSLDSDEVVPVDAEGSYLLKRVPVIGREVIVKTKEVAQEVALALKEHPIVIVRGHGSFATGQLLEEALHWTTALEESAHILWLRQIQQAIKGR